MKNVTSVLGRWLAPVALCSLVGCADQEDRCGAESLRLEITPATACLQLSAKLDTQPGFYQIVGVNSCADSLTVQSPATHDGGASYTFPAGATVTIPLNDSEVFNQDTSIKTWERNAVLGTETVTITMTKMPC